MNNLYIYKRIHRILINGEPIARTYTVIFCEGYDLAIGSVQSEIKQYYEANNYADKIVVIAALYIKDMVNELFVIQQQETFKYIPKIDREYLKDNLAIYCFDNNGDIYPHFNRDIEYEKNIGQFHNEGLLQIFKTRGGLIETHGTHHFVFPSGKHCDKFLRTGNILLYSSEIYFIASCLLRFTKGKSYNKIMCDTSSINTLAYALQDIQRRNDDKYKMLPVSSFSSYEGMLKATTNDLASSLILISSSTSANILSRIADKHRLVKQSNIIVLYYLGDASTYYKKIEQILCNLTRTVDNENGIEQYQTYTQHDCAYCRTASHAIEIRGDVFLLEKPKVNGVLIQKTDAPKYLSVFAQEFQTQKKENVYILKANYKESSKPGLKYDVYIDFSNIIANLKLFPTFRDKLLAYINQYIPSNTIYLVHLNDEGSKTLANYIFSEIKRNYKKSKVPVIISQDEISKIDESKRGSVVIVASCISNGKNLLYISRSLRQHENKRLIYFVGLVRMKNPEMLLLLKGNLKYGFYGRENNSFIEVLSINCDNEARKTTWQNELNFLRNLKDNIDEFSEPVLLDKINERIRIIEESESDINKGLANHLFYPRVSDDRPLSIRKGFAFFDFTGYHNTVSQADIYFTISNVLNNMRSCKKSLSQSEYVRNLIAPSNFNRYNDGIIQASILRASHYGELTYDIDREMSDEMRGILETMIIYSGEDQGEALLEFLYAIAVRKLTLKKEHLEQICGLVNDNIKNNLALKLVESISSFAI